MIYIYVRFVFFFVFRFQNNKRPVPNLVRHHWINVFCNPNNLNINIQKQQQQQQHHHHKQHRIKKQKINRRLQILPVPILQILLLLLPLLKAHRLLLNNSKISQQAKKPSQQPLVSSIFFYKTDPRVKVKERKRNFVESKFVQTYSFSSIHMYVYIYSIQYSTLKTPHYV